MIKGLTGFLVVAAVVFAFGAANNLKSQNRYAAKVRDHDHAAAAAAVASRANANASSASVLTATSAGKIQNAITNVANQARRKTPRT